MAETEVSVEVPKMVAVEEKCGLDMSSYQDLPKSDCNGANHHSQVNDLDNSYVFVTGADDDVGDKDVNVGGSSFPPEPEDSQNGKTGAVCKEAQHLNGRENGNVGHNNGGPCLVNSTCNKDESSHVVEEGVQISDTDSPESEVKQVEDSVGNIESLAEGEGFKASSADSVEVHNVITESAAEADVTQVEDSNGRTESVSEAEIEKAVDQNGEIEGVAEGQQDNLDGITIAESPLCPVENQEPQVMPLGLAAEIGENKELDNVFTNNDSSNSPIDGEDHSNTSAAEALEAEQRSEDVADVGEHELQSVGVEVEEEAKPTRELAEAAEHEVSSSISLGLDSESLLLDNKDKTFEEEARTDLSSDKLENQQGESGASNIVQDTVEVTDESKAMVTATDSHVQIACDLVLQEKNEDSSVSEFENGAQNCEESQVVNSSDSHVQTTCDLALEERNDDSSASEVENGAEHHEESIEQPAVSNTDSHAPTTGDLVSEEKDEDSSVSEIENGVQYHEEPEEEPVVSGNDSHVHTTCDIILDKENEDTPVSEVEIGAVHHEESVEQRVVSSSDSQVHTACVSVLEEKNGDSSLSEVEIAAQYHEESVEQPVVSSICNLALEEKNDDSSVSEVENAEHHEVSMEQPPMSSTDSHVQTTRDLVSEEKDEDSSVYDVENSSKYPEESQEQPDSCGASHDTTPSQTMNEASVQTQSNPAPNACAPQSETEVSDVEEMRRVSSLLVGPESQIIEEVVPVHDSVVKCIPDETSSGSERALDMLVPEVVDRSPETLDVKLESDSHLQASVSISGEKTGDVAVSCRTDISDSNSDGAANTELVVDVIENMEDQLDGAAGNSKKNLFELDNEKTSSQNEEASAASTGVSTTPTTEGEDKSIKTKTKPFNFLIRTPRFEDESIREKIRLAKIQVDEKTKLREAIQLQIQEIRANSQIHGVDYELSKGRSARKLVRSKRMEIDSLQSMINKAKNALSIEDIDSQIHNMEHMIQHETLPLKEEKQLIREIKQLKQLREQLSSNIGSQDEVKQALEQREEIEERLKILRKELDILKNKVLKAEATAAEAEKRYDDENRKIKELQAQFRAADEVRQAAYFQWQNLRKDLSKKSKYFFKFKDDAAVASNYAFSRDTEALYRLCTNQVGSFMEMWNTNPEFRIDYAKFNERSNIRRFGTLDCRSLGPNEVPLALPGYANERGNRMASTPAKVDLAPSIPSVELNEKSPSENVTSVSKSVKKVTEPKSEKVRKQPVIDLQVNGFDANTGSDLTAEVHEEPIKSKEETESLRKAEELRRAEAEAKLKEQRRLEALAKANEARERKKRQAEKLQQRAELKTQKEAEQREKEREKRLRKKERKKTAVTDTNDTNSNCETAASSESAAENGKDIDVKELPPAATKKPNKPWLAAKQSKTKSIPPPIRNRNKKKLQQWMWVGITSVIILVIFWLGNTGVFSSVALKSRAPVY